MEKGEGKERDGGKERGSEGGREGKNSENYLKLIA